MDDQGINQAALGALRASGFPFQISVTELIRKTPGYSILQEEFPWKSEEDGRWRFLDTLAVKTDRMNLLAIECKKTKKETYTFLKSSQTPHGNVHRLRCVYLSQIQDSTQRLEAFCGDWQAYPASGEALFCVVGNSSSGDKRLLEPDARNVTNAALAYTKHYRKKFNANTAQPFHSNRVIVPVIVTNAQLYECNQMDVSMESGELPSDVKIHPLPWIRFRKAFGVENTDIEESSIFIVRATELKQFLAEFAVETASPSESERIQLQL